MTNRPWNECETPCTSLAGLSPTKLIPRTGYWTARKVSRQEMHPFHAPITYLYAHMNTTIHPLQTSEEGRRMRLCSAMDGPDRHLTKLLYCTWRSKGVNPHVSTKKKNAEWSNFRYSPNFPSRSYPSPFLSLSDRSDRSAQRPTPCFENKTLRPHQEKVRVRQDHPTFKKDRLCRVVCITHPYPSRIFLCRTHHSLTT